MEIKIQSIRFDADKQLLEQIRTKVEKLQKFDASLAEAQVYLKLDAELGGFHEKVVEIKLTKPGNTYFSKAERGTFEDGLDEVLEALEVQVKKQRDKEKS
ncbi:MAG TPA: HPF/RaiA family ribosome-associated protein [Cyclobacteriaceae bacterium]|nr:HPF/RaiA family ribosome-associated protein [Chitinophagales bacterium]HNK83547.1 HPF/RaiA family ribosome-associated protein [Cyclobacteriaceae bacterium]HNE45402.1 HPF/RaiA family ribosome-associated protein [Chitinophagales bacterium]HNF69358.1 HPF/RaiA family ribosome-associated protein [Chitinophagales bacterium]HNI53514.1 HPF/RaiA family ribosome-associated protein [Chitinophagales bacterium]